MLVNSMASIAQREMLQFSDPSLLGDTTFCVDDQGAKGVLSNAQRLPPNVESRVLGLAESASECPSIVTMLSSSCGGNS